MMHRLARWLLPLAALSAFGEDARLLPGMGDYRFGISSPVPEARRFFDQAMVLAWGLHFAEARRSFAQAASLDPGCAICLWGLAHAQAAGGARAESRALQEADAALASALALAPRASARERALIEAAARRFADPANPSRARHEEAYLRAMADAARRFPDDADVLTLHADAQMAPRGRDFWTREGTARPWTPRILETLERALRRSPAHPGANRLYVHALEGSPFPLRALRSADRLRSLAPGVAHLVHVASHVYYRLGRHADAARANEEAIAADRASLALGAADPADLARRTLHFRHFLWAAALMSGRERPALQAANELARTPDADDPGSAQYFAALPQLTRVRFGLWSEILSAPPPPAGAPFAAAAAAYARGMALLRGGELVAARAELESLESSAASERIRPLEVNREHPAPKLLAWLAALLRAELATALGDGAAGIEHAAEAVGIELALERGDPPPWHMPARHTLGALLVIAGRAAEAERAYREDLAAHPDNGWALAGLAESLERQGRRKAAAEARQRFQEAWLHADVRLKGSRF